MKSLREEYNRHMSEWRPSIEELPGDLKDIAESIAEQWPDQAVDITLHLYARFPQVHVYFRNYNGLRKGHRDAWIKSLPRLDQGERITARDLAIVTGLSEREIEKIRPSIKSKDKQINLFK